MIQGRRWRPPVSPRENPWQADACRKEAGHADASPVTLPVCDVSGMFFSDVIFLWLPCLLLFFFFFLFLFFLFFLFFPFLSCLWLFRASPGGAGCRERSQRSCLRPGGLPSLTRNPGLQRPFRSRRLCRAVACAPGIPAKGRRDVGATPFRKPRFTSLRRVPAHCLPGATHPYESLSPGLIQPQPAALTVQGK